MESCHCPASIKCNININTNQNYRIMNHTWTSHGKLSSIHFLLFLSFLDYIILWYIYSWTVATTTNVRSDPSYSPELLLGGTTRPLIILVKRIFIAISLLLAVVRNSHLSVCSQWVPRSLLSRGSSTTTAATHREHLRQHNVTVRQIEKLPISASNIKYNSASCTQGKNIFKFVEIVL